MQLLTARGPVTQPHPLRQAWDYALELVDLMKRDPALGHADGPFAGRLLFPYGWGVERALAQRGLPLQTMGAQAVRRFDWGRPSIKLLTMHSAKGLEFGLVFVASLQALPMRDESFDEALRLLYVAMTRASRELVLSGHGESAMLRRVRQALAEVARQFSAMPA